MAVDASAVARVLGIETIFEDLRAGSILFLPQRIVVLAQASTLAQQGAGWSNEKYQATSAAQAGARDGFGSQVHLALLELLPPNGDGVGSIPVTVYPLEDGYEATTAAGSITPTGSQTVAGTYRVRAGGIQSNEFTVAVGDSVATRCAAITAAMNAVLPMPLIAVDGATLVDVDAKWAGPTGNDIELEVISTGSGAGGDFTIVQPTGGGVDPDITVALDQMGNVWETMLLNCAGDADAVLDEIQTFGEGRWGLLVRKPFVSFYGNTDVAVSTATTITDARSDDRINSQLVSPGSVDLPFRVAARQLARIAKVANNNPPRDYGSQKATGLIPGADGDQWDYPERDQAVKEGSSTIEVRNGVVNISDVVTCYHPTGEEPPAYRHVCDVVKLQNVIFNTDLLFANEEWDGAPLIPDDQPTVNPDARKPKSAKALVAGMIDQLALNAIISDPETAKASIVASINSQNPKRLDLEFTVQLSGNTNIKSVTLKWGFFFGSSAVVA
jgi:phage tail sheath gpL-like